jgi:hypothetical protein
MRYNSLHHSLTDPAVFRSEDDRQMVELLRMISSDYQVTVTPFTYVTFKERLRGELARLFQAGVELVQTRNQRAILLDALAGSEPLTRGQVEQLIALTTDEYESNWLASLRFDAWQRTECVTTSCSSRSVARVNKAFNAWASTSCPTC